MPSNRAHARLEKVLVRLITCTSMNEMNLWMTLGRTRGRVDVVTTKVSSKLESFRDGKVGKVLVSKGYNLTLGDVTSEFILSSIIETAQLDALNLSADCWSKMRDFGV
jgi:hypothetical protein